ncbi:chemotaxis protein CheV [Chitinivibrio alkaliphilus]|uniref:Chemotaxis protein CheW n=1 Tax=Chitinivibrio alkaliphilus ACht1 TaxID=1313304 RepID=U7D7B3_9BACT|nr:chemotaxis protein [Chitinivibrio alkaliphilus]ERP31461.1 chemotaxis protein CheW [Chitinivibrio alkaliphilus ACht1]
MFTEKKEDILLESGTNEVEFLVVEVQGQLFGINVAKVRSIQQYFPDKVTPIPDSHPAVLGMWRERKETINLIDLAGAIGKEKVQEYEREIIVVTEFNAVVNSFLVQGVRRIYRISWDNLTPVSEFSSTNSHVTGSVYIDDTEIMILDLEQIISQIYPDMIIEKPQKAVSDPDRHKTREQLFVLFAEDSKLIRSSVAEQLVEGGFSSLESFENGLDLFEYLRKEFATISATHRVVILTDIEMPKMDGLTLTKRVREDFPDADIPVIVFSSLINQQMIEKCKSVGADRYIAKPSYTQLMNCIDEFCN